MRLVSSQLIKDYLCYGGMAGSYTIAAINSTGYINTSSSSISLMSSYRLTAGINISTLGY